MLLRKSNRQTSYTPTGSDEVKSQEVLDHMDEDDREVFPPNLLGKYVNRPDHTDFDQMCYADFAVNCISPKAPVKLERDDIRTYTEPAGTIDD